MLTYHHLFFAIRNSTMSQKRQQYQRKNFYTHKEFQLKFITKFCLLLLTSVILSTALLFFFSQGSLTSTFQNSHLAIKQTSLAILPAIIYTNLITIGLISIAAIVVTLFVSHRIFGPLVRLENELRTIGAGDLTTTVSLREKDELKGIAENVNIMTAGLHARVSAIRTEVAELHQAAAGLQESPGLDDRLQHLEQVISKNFKLHSQ